MTFDQIKERLRGRSVGIAGCGGLGSNCAVALARVGVGKLVIADFDVVTGSNLNRQYYFHFQIGKKKVIALKENILLIDHEIEVVPFDTRLDRSNIPEIFADCDVIVEAFDHSDQKQMLIETVLAELPGKFLVTGLGMAGWGNSNAIHCRRIDNMFICGDEESEVGPDLPPIAPRVGMVANMQANVVVEILLGEKRW
jgi:sulfur carrier protein ThiS adenylyltransferase